MTGGYTLPSPIQLLNTPIVVPIMWKFPTSTVVSEEVFNMNWDGITIIYADS